MNPWAHMYGKTDEQPEATATLADVPEGDYPDGVLTVTDSDFDEVVRRFDVVVVDCWAPWCMPCLAVAPVVAELATEYQGRIVFGKLNVDEARNTAGRYDIQSIPTLLLFKKGELAHGVIGALSKESLQTWLHEHALD